MPPLPATRPSQPAALGDHEGRVRALERSRPVNPYAYLSTGTGLVTVPVPGGGASQQLITFDPADPANEFTANSDLFTLESVVVSGAAYFNAGTIYSVQINAAGRYKFTRTLFSGFALPSDEAVTLAYATGSNFAVGAFQIGNSDRVIDQYQYVTNILDVTDVTGPIVVSVQNNTGGGDIDVVVTILVELLDDESHGGIS